MPRTTKRSPGDSPQDVSLEPAARRRRVQSAETGMTVLKGLAELGGRASLTVLAAHVGEAPAKVHRYLASLMQEALVAQDTGTQQYFLGTAAIHIGVAAMRQADPLRLAEPALVRLRESLEVTCFLAVLGNKGPTIVRFEEPGLPVTVNVRVGSVMPLLWSATGRAFLGSSDERGLAELARAELAAATPEQLALLPPGDAVTALRAEFHRTGCASVRDTNLRGISAIAAPIRDHTGAVRAVLTALGATGGFDADVTGPVAAAVKREADLLSATLGYVQGSPAASKASMAAPTGADAAPALSGRLKRQTS